MAPAPLDALGQQPTHLLDVLRARRSIPIRACDLLPVLILHTAHPQRLAETHLPYRSSLDAKAGRNVEDARRRSRAEILKHLGRAPGVVHRFVGPHQVVLEQDDVRGKRESETWRQGRRDMRPGSIEEHLALLGGCGSVLARYDIAVRIMRGDSVAAKDVINRGVVAFDEPRKSPREVAR